MSGIKEIHLRVKNRHVFETFVNVRTLDILI